MNVKTAKLRAGSYFPPFVESRLTAEKALAAGIQEAFYEQPPWKAIQRTTLSGLVAAIHPACQRACKFGFDGTRESAPIYIREVKRL